MRTPREAIADILDRVEPVGETEFVPLSECVSRVLAADIVADIDLPPFEKSAMDGWAVRSADFVGDSTRQSDSTRLRVVGESKAGTPFAGAVNAGECVAIYTGGELPPDTDSVVMVENSERDGDTVLLRDQPQPAQHVCHRGEDLGQGQTVLTRGTRVRHSDLSALASAGADPVSVFKRPRVRVLTTGDELVAPSEVPGPGEIREGNTLHLTVLASRVGTEAVNLGVIRDDVDALEAAFRSALDSADCVITTGGVSMGKYDLVGDVMEKLGVELVFHKVAIKPGKPLWFGMRGKVPVFCLPGNPVSCLVGHEVFVRPALARLCGASEDEWTERVSLGRWTGAPPRSLPREQNIPVRTSQAADGVTELEPVRWRGSGDVVGLSKATALAICPPDETLATGSLVEYRTL